jgi:hypothetical protein
MEIVWILARIVQHPKSILFPFSNFRKAINTGDVSEWI